MEEVIKFYNYKERHNSQLQKIYLIDTTRRKLPLVLFFFMMIMFPAKITPTPILMFSAH